MREINGYKIRIEDNERLAFSQLISKIISPEWWYLKDLVENDDFSKRICIFILQIEKFFKITIIFN